MHPALRIVVIEDYQELRQLIVSELLKFGHQVTGVESAEDLAEEIAQQTPDMIIVDINLPGENGFSLARRMRSIQPEIGIIILTARTSPEDRVEGYVSGTDIYLTKPVTFDELTSAVQSLSRRLHKNNTSWTQRGHTSDTLILDTKSLQIKGAAGVVPLTSAEFFLLQGLIRAPGQQLEYWQVIEILGKSFDDQSQRLLEVQTSRLRGKLVKAGAHANNAIRALRLKGYQLCCEIKII